MSRPVMTPMSAHRPAPPSQPRFSIVIPTRERADTLAWTLRNCAEQEFDNFEIVVSDNFSSPATKKVVDDLGSHRVRYFRTPEPLAMSANWEFGVAQARGEYLLVVGDDDGLVPGALARADQLLRESGLAVIRWDWIFYNWPNHLFPNQANRLEVPLGRGFTVADGMAVIERVVNGGDWHPALPMLYNSVVRRDILETIKKAAGRVFGTLAPDIYSGMAIAATAMQFGNLESPLSICGSSGSTTGGNAMFNPNSPIAKEFWDLNARAGVGLHRTTPDLSVLPACYADTFQFCKEYLFPDDTTRNVDRLAMSLNTLRDHRVRNDAERQIAIGKIVASLADVPELRDAFLARAPDVPSPPVIDPKASAGEPMWVGLRSDKWFCFNAADYGVTNVYEAAKLSAKIVPPAGPSQQLQDLQARLIGAERRLAELERGPTESEARTILETSLSCWPHRAVRRLRRLFR